MDTKNKRLIHLIKSAQEEYAEDNYLVAIPGFMSKKFIAFCSMREDLNLVLEYVGILKTSSLDIRIKSSLTYSIIALYGKCFTDASKNSCPKIEPDFEFNGKPDLRETHDFLMELRHQFIAHRGKNEGETGISFMVIPKIKEENSQLRFKQLKLYAFDSKKLVEIENIAKYLIEQLENKIIKNGKKVHEKFFKLFDVEQIQFMIMNYAKI